MTGLQLIEGDGKSVVYLLPAHEALDYLAQRSWADLIQRCHAEHQRGNRDYAVQFTSSIAAAYEIQSWALHHQFSELCKVVFFRKLALALALKAKKDEMAELTTMYAFSLLVKATFENSKSGVCEALKQIRLVIASKPTASRTTMLLARMLLWAVCDSDDSEDTLGDLDTAIQYIEMSMTQAPNQYNDTYGAPQSLQRAYQARYILKEDESDLQKVLSLRLQIEGDAPEAEGDDFYQRLRAVRERFCANQITISEAMHSLVGHIADSLTKDDDQSQSQDEIEDHEETQESGRTQNYDEGQANDTCQNGNCQNSNDNQEDGDSEDHDELQDDDQSEEDDPAHGLYKLHHTLLPDLAREALEAGLLACQSPVEVEEDRKQKASNYLLGLHYSQRSGTRKNPRFDLEKAISYLQVAQNEQPVGSTEEQYSSICLAEAHWKLGLTIYDVTEIQVGMHSMASLLDRLATAVYPTTFTLLEMMSKSYTFWKSNKRDSLLVNAAKFVAYLLSDDNVGRLSPGSFFGVLCVGGEIAASLWIEQPTQTLLQEPFFYWTRCWRDKRAQINVRLHAMHLAAQQSFKQGCFEEAFRYARTAVELIRFACPADLEPLERERLIPLLNGISVDACASGVKLGRVEEALELLEQGRGILNFPPDAFTDSLDDLRREHPALFLKFDRCRQSIVELISTQSLSESRIIHLESANETQEDADLLSMSQILAHIREQSGFKDFYRPITAAEMQRLATKGPIVVLVGSSLHPCAIIVRREGIHAVDLTPETVVESPFWGIDDLQQCTMKLSHILGIELVQLGFSSDDHAYAEVTKLSHAERSETLKGLLAFLWIAVVEPINRVLNYLGPKVEREGQGITLTEAIIAPINNRITWIRTGMFTRMPVHVSTDNNNLPFLMRAINSYTASFQSLSASHSRHQKVTPGSEQGLFITMPSKVSRIPKDSPFLNAATTKAEMDGVAAAANTITWSTLERPSAQQVKEHFSEAKFLHIICHGVTNRKEPRKSHLKLWQETGPGRGRVDPLYISEISSWMTRKTALVFLSACSVADAESQDFSGENLDIANAFAVAGVPDVVGSMWEVESSVASAVAETFWNFLCYFMPKYDVLEGELVARALQVAVTVVSGDWRGDPLTWAGFIHVGGMGSATLKDVREDESDDDEKVAMDMEDLKLEQDKV
ncbi:MAG: hypothetical protein Q9219_007077 [cf. Caloplaca sp. 3 TL-2023]